MQTTTDETYVASGSGALDEKVSAPVSVTYMATFLSEPLVLTNLPSVVNASHVERPSYVLSVCLSKHLSGNFKILIEQSQ